MLTMANKIITRSVQKYWGVQNFAPVSRILEFSNLSRLHTSHHEVPVKEIRIPVPWGHLAAKLWGSENERPILALHGWQDNAGTWDPLAPMLCKKRPILALDFPGHGYSSWIPEGMHYYSWELPRLILWLKQYFKWDKVSLLAHSMGSIAACRFACLFNEDADFFIAIDNVIYDDYDLDQIIDRYPKMLQKVMVAQTQLHLEPPSYPLEEISKIWHLGTKKSVSLEGVKYLLKRGSKASKSDPNKYYFNRDRRLKYILFFPEDKKIVEGYAARLKCPTLYIKAVDSPYASDSHSVNIREFLENNNEKFETHFVPGTHHVHLNNPETVFPLIENFLQKYNFCDSSEKTQ